MSGSVSTDFKWLNGKYDWLEAKQKQTMQNWISSILKFQSVTTKGKKIIHSAFTQKYDPYFPSYDFFAIKPKKFSQTINQTCVWRISYAQGSAAEFLDGRTAFRGSQEARPGGGYGQMETAANSWQGNTHQLQLLLLCDSRLRQTQEVIRLFMSG